MEEVAEAQRLRPVQRLHHLPPHVVPAVLLRTTALQEEDGGWHCTHVVVGVETVTVSVGYVWRYS